MKPVTNLRAPVQGPPTQHAIPHLWERVRIMFKAAFIVIANTAALANWRKVPHDMRSDLMPRLVPLEHLVRVPVTLEAITFLIMTHEGRRFLRETPKTPIPEPRIAPLVAKLSDGMNADGEMMETEPGALYFPSSNPAGWNAHLSVLRWRIPPAEADAESAPAPVATEDICSENLPPRLPTRDGARRPDRRVEALSRVLADPGPAIGRSGIFLADLPRDILAPPEPGKILSRWWWRGRPEWFNACALAQRAFALFDQLIEPGKQPSFGASAHPAATCGIADSRTAGLPPGNRCTAASSENAASMPGKSLAVPNQPPPPTRPPRTDRTRNAHSESKAATGPELRSKVESAPPQLLKTRPATP